jgi:NhaA family Na+:H+ antiporter
LLVSCLAGIGFTMAIFTATLAFHHDALLLEIAKLGVLIGSLISALFGLGLGILLIRRLRKSQLRPLSNSP